MVLFTQGDFNAGDDDTREVTRIMFEIKTVFRDEFVFHGKTLIVDTCDIEGVFETMAMWPSGKEIDVRRTIDFKQARENHDEFVSKYGCSKKHGNVVVEI